MWRKTQKEIIIIDVVLVLYYYTVRLYESLLRVVCNERSNTTRSDEHTVSPRGALFERAWGKNGQEPPCSSKKQWR